MKLIAPILFTLTILLQLHSAIGCPTPDAQVLIVGGGPAGIQAAATLVENGIDDYLIIEDSEQLRGYLEPVEFGGHTFAPGSLFGYTPIRDKLDELDVSYSPVDILSFTAYSDQGENITDEARERFFAFASSVGLGFADNIYEDLDNNVKPDISQKALVARGGWLAYTPVDKLMEWWNTDFYSGLSPRYTSTTNSFKQSGALFDALGEHFRTPYFILDDRTLAYPLLSTQEELIDESKIVWNERVRVVNQTSDECVICVTENGTSYVGKYVILTNTVGVLQSGSITFDPPLPPWKYEEFCRWQMGTIDTIFLKFSANFWDDTEWILHASPNAGYYPAFLNLEAEGYHPAGTNILIGFVTGKEANRVERMTDEEVLSEVIQVLGNIYGDESVPEPDEFYMSRFQTDVDLFGSLTNWPIGTLPEDGQTRLRSHIDRVYFALEGAADEYVTIPFGSINDGKASAEAVVTCITDGDCEEYTPVDSTLPLCSKVNPNNPKKRRKGQ